MSETYGLCCLNAQGSLRLIVVEPDDYRVHDIELVEHPPNYATPPPGSADVFIVTKAQKIDDAATVVSRLLGRIHLVECQLTDFKSDPVNFCKEVVGIVGKLANVKGKR